MNRRMLWTCLLPLAMAALPWAVRADDASPIRYAWQANQKYAYKVEIQATKSDETETLWGTPLFTVKSVAKDGAVVHITNERLASKTERKQGAFPGIRPPRIPPPPRIGPPGSINVVGHELTLDARGRVVKERGDSRVGFLLGDLQELILPQFPEKADKSWKSSRELVIRVTQQGRIPSPFRDDVELKRMNAEEVNEYTLDAADEKSATLTRKYSLTTVETVDGEPAIEVTGEAQIVFDRVRGVPSRIEYTGKIIEREENSQSKVPLKVSIALLSAEEQAKIQAEEAARIAAQKAPPTIEERAEILKNVGAAEIGKWLPALQTLQQKQPAEPDAEVAAALAAQLSDPDNSRRFQIGQALEAWATEREVPLLIKALDDSFQPVANSAMAALGRLKTPEGIEALVKQLDKQAGRLAASKALKAAGPAAEGAVLKSLESNEWMARLEGVSILAEIGSPKSSAALQDRADNDSNALIRQRAKSALDKVRERDKEPAKP